MERAAIFYCLISSTAIAQQRGQRQRDNVTRLSPALISVVNYIVNVTKRQHAPALVTQFYSMVRLLFLSFLVELQFVEIWAGAQQQRLLYFHRRLCMRY